MTPDRLRYRFGPLERRGLIAGWRGGQIVSVALGLVVGVIALRAGPGVGTVLVAVVSVAGGVALACWPVSGRTGEEWLPTVVRWSAQNAQGARRFRWSGPVEGHARCSEGAGEGAICLRSDDTGRRRGPFEGLAILEVDGGPNAQPFGVLHDRRGRTYAAVLAVRSNNFALLGVTDKERRIAGWSTVLAGLARERSTVHRLQWIAAALLDDGGALRAHLAQRGVEGEAAAARRSYEDLLRSSGATTCRHETLIVVQVSASRVSGRAARAAGGGASASCALLWREVSNLRRLLDEADVTVEQILTPAALSAVVRRSGEDRPLVGDGADGEACRDRCRACATWPWPMAVATEWGCLRTDATWHATYWISEWPRVDVGPDFLGPLLLGSVRRSVAVVMEPLSPSRAVRQVEQARTADLADSELRRRGGFLSTARRAREEAFVSRREQELADGHASFRFSGYVTVTAGTREELERACEATEQAAGQCRLELRRLYGDQDRGFMCTLPLCRGLS